MPLKRESSHRTGRPAIQASNELDDAILAAAERLFTLNGYAGTSMEQIAAAAGSGKQTIYRRYPSKEALFEAVIWAVTAKLLSAITVPESAGTDPLVILREACRRMLDFVCEPEVIAIYRVLIAEAERFPGVVDDAMRGSKEQHDVYLQPLVRAAQSAGSIRDDVSAETLGNALSGLMTGWVVNQGLLGEFRLADASDRAAYFDHAWNTFLWGVSRG